MKRTLAATTLALAATLAFGPVAHGATDEQRAAAQEKWDSMTPEQKAAAREGAKEKWDSMTPEEKAAAKERAKSKWDSMTPEQQAEAKKKHPRAARALEGRSGNTAAPTN